MKKYDSTEDVKAHIARVAFWVEWICDALMYRASVHDASKLLPPEKEVFDEYTPKLKELEFGSDEYKAALAGMGEGLQHHYKNNPHHPEYFVSGIDGMGVVDLVEMIADWMAAASVKDQKIDLDYLQDRFGLSDQLRSIIWNTLNVADMDATSMNIPHEYEQRHNFAE